MRRTCLFTLVLLAAAGCKPEKPIDPELNKLGRATGPVQNVHADVDRSAHTAQTASGNIHAGVIVETIDVTQYTYLKLKTTEDKEIWAAVIKGPYKTGDTVHLQESIVMTDFRSPTLDRTFDSIVFGAIVTP